MGTTPKKRAQELKKLKTTSVLDSNAISTAEVPLTFNKFEKTKLGNFDFVHLLLSFFVLPQAKLKK